MESKEEENILVSTYNKFKTRKHLQSYILKLIESNKVYTMAAFYISNHNNKQVQHISWLEYSI